MSGQVREESTILNDIAHAMPHLANVCRGKGGTFEANGTRVWLNEAHQDP